MKGIYVESVTSFFFLSHLFYVHLTENVILKKNGNSHQRREPLAKECGLPLEVGQHEENSSSSDPTERKAWYNL